MHPVDHRACAIVLQEKKQRAVSVAVGSVVAGTVSKVSAGNSLLVTLPDGHKGGVHITVRERFSCLRRWHP